MAAVAPQIVYSRQCSVSDRMCLSVPPEHPCLVTSGVEHDRQTER